MKTVRFALLTFVLAFTAQVALRAAPSGSFAVQVEGNVRTPMRDGVALVSDIYRPNAEGKFPVLLTRTPYNRASPAAGMELASHGYVVIQQDVRGRHQSEGEFYPFRHEAHDGYDTIEWAAALPYSDGRVGMFGGSYVGATQMLAASAAPPHLVGIFPYITSSEYYDGWTYHGGALSQWFVGTWASYLALDTLSRKTVTLPSEPQWFGQLPLEDYRLLKLPAVADTAPYFHDWIEHETDDEYWRQVKVSDHYEKMNVKALHAGGWHDLFAAGSIRNFIGMQKRAPSDAARKGQRLLFGPWGHGPTSPEGKIGDVTFGKQAVLKHNETVIKWYDYVMKGAQNEFASNSPVKIFVMGDNVWRDETEFPLARTTYRKYYLRGDRSLSAAAPRAEKPEVFEYDPANPVPTIGGRDNFPVGAGPFDQRSNESRADVLVYSTPVLRQDVEVTGFVTVELYAATSAADTDFTAMIVDVDEKGYARYLADGIIRARYRNTTARAEPIEPNKVYKYTIDLWATSNVFKAGHRIRVYISSSNFPRIVRNLNTGEKTFGGVRMQKARQTIYHDAKYPSAIVLPVIPRKP
jgi:uncharacterized protein